LLPQQAREAAERNAAIAAEVARLGLAAVRLGPSLSAGELRAPASVCWDGMHLSSHG